MENGYGGVGLVISIPNIMAQPGSGGPKPNYDSVSRSGIAFLNGNVVKLTSAAEFSAAQDLYKANRRSYGLISFNLFG